MTGRISVDLYSSLDGVCQSPGAADEDPEGGFAFGGWLAPLAGAEDGAQVVEGILAMDALLLGRRTYDIFAAYWPHHTDGPAGAIGRRFAEIPKYVASRGTPDLGWRDSHLLAGDLAAELATLRQRHRDIHVIGSLDFCHTLLAEGLLDQLNLWVYPVVLGAGKRLFTPDGPPAALELLAAEPASSRGAVLLRYGWTGGVPQTGDMGGGG
jgi:dihydrofolate reductase